VFRPGRSVKIVVVFVTAEVKIVSADFADDADLKNMGCPTM
jgi:hypothetical protein